jgi:hypothetical protein
MPKLLLFGNGEFNFKRLSPKQVAEVQAIALFKIKKQNSIPIPFPI